MTKKIMIPILMMLLIVGVVNASHLVFSEDFESYPIGGLNNYTWINESGGKWYCVGGSSGCFGGTGSPVDDPQYFLEESGGDTNLRTIGSYDDSSNYGSVILYFNLSTQVDRNHTLVYDVKVVNVDEDDFNDAGGTATYFWSGFRFSSINNYLVSWLGGVITTVGFENYQRIRPDRSGTYSSPTNSSCDVNDGQWHTVTQQNIYNISKPQYDNMKIFVDGVQCMDYYNDLTPFAGGTDYDYMGIQTTAIFNTAWDNIKLYNGTQQPEQTSNCTTTCTTWENPYILKEDFNGYINTCDWAVTENICFSGQLTRDTTDGYYTIYKNTDYVSNTDVRYVTVSFDLQPTDIETNGKVSVTIFDSDSYGYLRFFVGELGKFYNYADGNMDLVFGNTSTSESNTVQLHIDFSDDDYDVWYDGTKVSSSNSFYDDFVNIEDINAIRITSQNAEYELSNLEIFTSDQNNEPLIVDIGNPISIIDEDKKFCGLFYKETPECTYDSDCETGSCLPSGTCSSFDMTYCDENGHPRGNYCVIAGLTSCTLESSANLILDNFLLFLVFLILLVVAVYIIYAFK